MLRKFESIDFFGRFSSRSFFGAITIAFTSSSLSLWVYLWKSRMIAKHQRNVIRAAEDRRTVREDNTRSQGTAFEPRLCASRRRGARSAAPTTPYPRARRQYKPHHPVAAAATTTTTTTTTTTVTTTTSIPPRYRRLASSTDIAAECLLWSSLGCWFTLSLADSSGTHLRRTPQPEIPSSRSRSLLSSPDFATKLPHSG